MRTLLSKELRQVLPAHVLLSLLFALFWWLTTTPEDLVALQGSGLRERHLLIGGVYLIEGLVLGFAQFGAERWNRTEAYLVHRGTGVGGAFAAKLVAGLVALAVLVVAPLALWLAAQLASGGWIEGAPLAHLGHALGVATTCLGGYAVGAFATQLRGTWSQRVCLGVLAGCTVLYAAKIGADPVEALGQASLARFVAVQAVLAVAVLAVAFGLFRSGEDSARTWPPVVAAAFAVVALELFTLPYIVAPAAATRALRRGMIEAGPAVVQASDGTLYRAEELDGRRWSLTDAEGRPAPDGLARDFNGWGRDDDPLRTLYRPSSIPLSWTQRPDDALEPRPARSWVFERPARRILTGAEDARYDVVRGRLALVVRDERGDGRWVELEVPARMGVCYPSGVPFGERRPPLLVDVAGGRLFALDATPGREPRLVEQRLPDGDRVVGVQRSQTAHRLRAGLFEPLGTSDSLVVLGERGPYTWLGDRLAPTAEVDADRLAGLVPPSGAVPGGLRLAPVDVDGLGHVLEVRDAATGRVRLEVETRAGPLRAATMHLSTLVSAPVAALVSWSRPPIEPTRADRATSEPLADPLLLGRSRTGLLAAVLALGALLAVSTWRTLGRAGSPPLARSLWTVGTLFLGLSAWFLARLFAPRGTPARTTPSREAVAEAQLVIRTV